MLSPSSRYLTWFTSTLKWLERTGSVGYLVPTTSASAQTRCSHCEDASRNLLRNAATFIQYTARKPKQRRFKRTTTLTHMIKYLGSWQHTAWSTRNYVNNEKTAWCNFVGSYQRFRMKTETKVEKSAYYLCHVCPNASPARLPLELFSWNFILETSIKICGEKQAEKTNEYFM